MTATLVDREIPSGDGVVGMVSFVDAVPGTCVDSSALLDLQFSDRGRGSRRANRRDAIARQHALLNRAHQRIDDLEKQLADVLTRPFPAMPPGLYDLYRDNTEAGQSSADEDEIGYEVFDTAEAVTFDDPDGLRFTGSGCGDGCGVAQESDCDVFSVASPYGSLPPPPPPPALFKENDSWLHSCDLEDFRAWLFAPAGNSTEVVAGLPPFWTEADADVGAVVSKPVCATVFSGINKAAGIIFDSDAGCGLLGKHCLWCDVWEPLVRLEAQREGSSEKNPAMIFCADIDADLARVVDGRKDCHAWDFGVQQCRAFDPVALADVDFDIQAIMDLKLKLYDHRRKHHAKCLFPTWSSASSCACARFKA